NFLARHVDCLQSEMRVLGCNWRFRTTPWHKQNVAKIAVAPHVSADHTVGAPAMAEHGRACSITEEDAGIPVLPARDSSQFVRPDHEHRIIGVGGDELLRDLNAK